MQDYGTGDPVVTRLKDGERGGGVTTSRSLASIHAPHDLHGRDVLDNASLFTTSDEPMIYKASRFTSGNRIFPTSLNVEGHQITYRKRRWFGSTEETINVDHISSVRAQHGMMFSSITIESSGGSQPIQITGLSNGDAREIEKAIKLTQAPTAGDR